MSDDQHVTGNEPSLSSANTSGQNGAEPQLSGDAALIHAIEALRNSDIQTQLRAEKFLAGTSNSQVVDQLLEILDHDSSIHRFRILRLLGQIRDKRATPILLQRLENADRYESVD